MVMQRHSVYSEWELTGAGEANLLQKWHVAAHVMRLRDLYDFSPRGKTFLYLLRGGLAQMDPEPRHSERHGEVHQVWAPDLTLSSLWPVLHEMVMQRHSVYSEQELAGAGKANLLQKWHVAAHAMRLRDLYDFSRRGQTFLYLLRSGLAQMDSEPRHSERHGEVHQVWAPDLTLFSLRPVLHGTVTMTQRLSVGLKEEQNGWRV